MVLYTATHCLARRRRGHRPTDVSPSFQRTKAVGVRARPASWAEPWPFFRRTLAVRTDAASGQLLCHARSAMKVDRSIKLGDHATVRTLKARDGVGQYNTAELDSDWLRQVALEAGADDVGFVSLDDPAVAEERDYVREALPGAQSLVSICLRSNRENMRSVARSVASHELFAV